MKLIVKTFIISTLSIFSGLYTNMTQNYQQVDSENFTNHKNKLTVSKIDNLDFDIKSVTTINDMIWAGSRINPPYSHEGLYKSTDGISFSKSLLDTELNSITSDKNGTLYLTDGSYLEKSIDAINFTPVNTSLKTVDCIAITSNDIIYIGVKNFLYKSNDGLTFNKIYDFSNLLVEKIVIAPNNDLYIMTGNGSKEVVTKSFDGGYNFIEIPNINFVRDICVTSNNIVYILGINLYKSTNNGISFNLVPNTREMIIITLFPGMYGNLYVTTVHSVCKLNDDDTFDTIWTFNEVITMGNYAKNGIIWIGTFHGLFKIWFT